MEEIKLLTTLYSTVCETLCRNLASFTKGKPMVVFGLVSVWFCSQQVVQINAVSDTPRFFLFADLARR